MHVWCKIFHLVSSICTSFLWRSRQNDFIFHPRRCAFYVPIFPSIFQSKKKKKSIDCISFFFRIAHVYIKKENKKNRTEISTPSSRYLLQKQVTKLRHLFNRNIPFFENEHYRNEDTRNAFCKILILENFILFKLSNKIQRRREKEKIFQQTIGINIYIIHHIFHTFPHESIIKF